MVLLELTSDISVVRAVNRLHRKRKRERAQRLIASI